MDIKTSNNGVIKTFSTLEIGLIEFVGASNEWIRTSLESTEVSALILADNAPTLVSQTSPLVAIKGLPEHHLFGSNSLAEQLAQKSPGRISERSAFGAIERSVGKTQANTKHYDEGRDYAVKVGAAATNLASAAIPVLSNIEQFDGIDLGALSPGISLAAAGFSGASMFTTWTDPEATFLKKVATSAGFASALGSFAVQVSGGNQAVADSLKFASVAFSFADKFADHPNLKNKSVLLTTHAPHYQA